MYLHILYLVINEDCINLDGDTECELWASRGYCDSEYYEGGMETHCTKACGLCDVITYGNKVFFYFTIYIVTYCS